MEIVEDTLSSQRVNPTTFNLRLLGKKRHVEIELAGFLDRLNYDGIDDNLVVSRVRALISATMEFYDLEHAIEVIINISSTPAPVTKLVEVAVRPLWGFCS